MAYIDPALFMALILYAVIGMFGVFIGALRNGDFPTVMLWYIAFMMLGAAAFPYLLGISRHVLNTLIRGG